MTGILEKLKWESLKKRSRLILLYKSLKGAASIPTDDLIPQIRRSRNHHSLTFQTPATRTDIYKGSFFPQTIRDWNVLPDSIITSAEGAEDGVARFTSLVRANFPYHRFWWINVISRITWSKNYPEIREHFIVVCESLNDIRNPYLNKIRSLFNFSSGINNVIETPELCAQLLDSSHLPTSQLETLSDHQSERVELYSREMIYRLHMQRVKLLKWIRYQRASCKILYIS